MSGHGREAGNDVVAGDGLIVDVRVRAADGRRRLERRWRRRRVRVHVGALDEAAALVAVCHHVVGGHHVAAVVGRDHNALAVGAKGDGRRRRAREHRVGWVQRHWRWRWRPGWQRRRVGRVGRRGRRGWGRWTLLVEAHLATQLLVEERAAVRVAVPLELVVAQQEGRVAVDGHAGQGDVVVLGDARAERAARGRGHVRAQARVGARAVAAAAARVASAGQVVVEEALCGVGTNVKREGLAVVDRRARLRARGNGARVTKLVRAMARSHARAAKVVGRECRGHRSGGARALVARAHPACAAGDEGKVVGVAGSCACAGACK